MDFENIDALMKELIELHNSYKFLSTTSTLIVQDYILKKQKELIMLLEESNQILTK